MMGQLFSEEEMEGLIQRFVAGMAPGMTFDEDTVLRWVRWCEHAKISATLVDGVLNGQVEVQWPGATGEPMFVKR